MNMHEIVCPHCEKAFKVDESGYAEILKQVHDKDFEKQLAERIKAVEDKHQLDIDNAVSHKQAAGFIVPDVFFETQKNQILSKALQTKAKKIRLSFNQLMTRVATIAATFTIAGFLFLQNNSGQSNELTASISNEEIVNHLEIADVSEDLICELLDQNKMNKKENEIEKYLNENADEDLLMDNS